LYPANRQSNLSPSERHAFNALKEREYLRILEELLMKWGLQKALQEYGHSREFNASRVFTHGQLPGGSPEGANHEAPRG
jgi:hypothetical protein